MKNFDVKFKRIFIPFLIISAASTTGYSFLRWLLFAKYNLFVVDQDILDFWGPVFFVLIPIIIWLGPRIQLLELSGQTMRGTPFSGFMIFATVAIGGPTMTAQRYLEHPTNNALLWTISTFLAGAAFFMLLLFLKPLRVDVAAAIDKRDKTQQIIDDITGKSGSEPGK